MTKLNTWISELETALAKLEAKSIAIGRLSGYDKEHLDWLKSTLVSLEAIRRSQPVRVDDKPRLITYKIVADLDGRLKAAARTACNFWNRFVSPATPIVIRLGVFTSYGNVIARAYEPYCRGGITYGRVEFNTQFLTTYKPNAIAGTIIHEIGHTLGFGWQEWKQLFDTQTGKFTQDAINQLPGLGDMRVELDFGRGTRLSHWDESGFGKELMTGLKNTEGEHILPVTIDVMELFGHRINERLPETRSMDELINEVSMVAFASKAEARSLDRDYYEITELFEEIPAP